MKIVYGTKYCTCAGINSWLRYLIAGTRHRAAWGMFYTKGYAIAQEDMRWLGDLNFGVHDFGDYLRLYKPDVSMVTYDKRMCEDALDYRDETGAPVVMLLHGKTNYDPDLIDLAERVDVTVVPSQTMYEDFGAWDGLDPDLLTMIYHGVVDFGNMDIQPYDFRSEFEIPDDHAIVGWAGRIDSQKGWETARKVIEKTTDLPVSYVIAGMGRPSYTGSFLQQVQDNPNMHWAQCISLHSMPAYYEAIDIGMSTSPYESFGLAVCEMAMHQVPVVAIECGAIREVMGSKATLVGDVDGLINGIMSLLDEDRRKDVGYRARMRVLAKKFTARRMGDDYIRLWEELLND